MAFLFDVAAGTHFPLAGHHTFGRLKSTVDTHVDRSCVSKLHAAIEWNGQKWRIRNLGTNGTWINDVWLGQNDYRELNLNDTVRLAEPTDPGFLVCDLAPPADMLWPLNSPGEILPVYLSSYHLLPDANAPELAIYFDEQQQQWFIESDIDNSESAATPLHHGDAVNVGGAPWRFVRAQIHGATEVRVLSNRKLTDFEFVFSLSMDEESTQLELMHLQTVIDLGVRTHHYLLTHLARQRARDHQEGLDQKSQGWLYSEQLAAELGLDVTHMNIQIFRARKQLSDMLHGITGQQLLLERRAGKIRFGSNRFKVYKGNHLLTAMCGDELTIRDTAEQR